MRLERNSELSNAMSEANRKSCRSKTILIALGNSQRSLPNAIIYDKANPLYSPLRSSPPHILPSASSVPPSTPHRTASPPSSPPQSIPYPVTPSSPQPP